MATHRVDLSGVVRRPSKPRRARTLEAIIANRFDQRNLIGGELDDSTWRIAGVAEVIYEANKRTLDPVVIELMRRREPT